MLLTNSSTENQNKIYGFVYLWFDTKRKKFCLGSHYGTLNDGYVSSTGYFPRVYKKRPDTCKRKILWVLENQDKKILLEKEQYFLNKIKDSELGVKYYNLKKTASGGNGHANKGTTLEFSEWRRRQSATIRGRTKENFNHLKLSGEKISKALSGRTKETHEYIQKTAELFQTRNKQNHDGIKRQSEKLTGRTKETHDGIKRQSEKMLGRTKETHDGIKRRSLKARKITIEQDIEIAKLYKTGIKLKEIQIMLGLQHLHYQSIVFAANRGNLIKPLLVDKNGDIIDSTKDK